MRAFLETVIFTLTRVYFFVINVVFSLINAFSPLVVVSPTSESLILLSARQAAAAIRAREITSVDLIEAYIQRIIEVNPLVNAVCEEGFDDARRRAKELDSLVAKATAADLEELATSHPLLGVPFTVKECLAVDGFRQTSGVVKDKDNIAAKEQMKEAGAICLATTNVPELCAAGETVNALYGKTSNPYDTRRSAAGSSGGEGALIGAAASLICCLHIVGIGTDIMGSIRAPSAACGVYGLMPSPGLTSMIGYFRHDFVSTPRREKILRSGPLCRHAEDLSLLLKVMSDGKAKVDEPISSLRIFYLEGIDSPLNEYTRMERVVTRAVSFLERKYATTAVEVKLPLAAFTQEMFAAEYYMPGQPTIAQTVADEPVEFSV